MSFVCVVESNDEFIFSVGKRFEREIDPMIMRLLSNRNFKGWKIQNRAETETTATFSFASSYRYDQQTITHTPLSALSTSLTHHRHATFQVELLQHMKKHNFELTNYERNIGTTCITAEWNFAKKFKTSNGLGLHATASFVP